MERPQTLLEKVFGATLVVPLYMVAAAAILDIVVCQKMKNVPLVGMINRRAEEICREIGLRAMNWADEAMEAEWEDMIATMSDLMFSLGEKSWEEVEDAMLAVMLTPTTVREKLRRLIGR